MSDTQQQIQALEQMQSKILALRAQLAVQSEAGVPTDDVEMLSAVALEQLDEQALSAHLGRCAIILAGLEARAQALGKGRSVTGLASILIVLAVVAVLLVGLLFILQAL